MNKVNKKEKNTFRLRTLLIISIILCFLFFLGVFIYQILQYKKVEERLNAAYSSNYSQSNSVYKLFSTFSEADNLFRLYTVDFKPQYFEQYKDKLTYIKQYVDSISASPTVKNSLQTGKKEIDDYQASSAEFAKLKKDIDNLVLFADDSLKLILESTAFNQKRNPSFTADSIISEILKDTLSMAEVKDTIVKEKQGLFKRIFKAKSDTLVNKSSHEVLNSKQIDVVHRNLDKIINSNEKIYSKNFINLKTAFIKLQKKERELIQSNTSLLNKLKLGIEKIKEQELSLIRSQEEKDFNVFRENFKRFGLHLIIALIIMTVLITYLIYYQYKVASFEKKLFLEKEYASKVAEEKTSVLANISHEIRTPLNSLKGIVNLLKNSKIENQIDQEIIQTVDHDITVINGTINDILNLGKIEADTLTIKFEKVNLHQLIEEIIGLHTYQAKTKKLTFITKNLISKDLLANTNAFRIKQVVSNLISNAIKYTEEGSVHVNATFIDSKNKKLVVQVIDTGIGIEDSKSDQVFRKYYVADDKNKVGGFGLGLYISKILTEQINGKLDFESKFGTGSTFTFEVPLDQIEFTQTVVPYTVQDIPDNCKIVFMDDSRISLFFVQQIFKDNNNIKYFQSSRKAWDYIQENNIDYIITDLKMPDLDGWDILKGIKSNPKLSHIKVFVSTAEPVLLEDKNNQEYKFDAKISKPINENELVTALMNS